MNAPGAGAQPLGVIWRLARPALPAAPAPTLPATFRWVEAQNASALAGAMAGEGAAMADHCAAGASEAAAMTAQAAAEVAQRLATGRRCCAAWTNGQIAAWGWVSFGTETVGELGLRLRLRPDEAYIWDCATGPAFRRRGLYTALLAHMAQALLAEGVSIVWIGADYRNAPSQAGIGGAGFTAIADLVAAPPKAGERRRRAWLVARPGSGPDLLADARRVYLDAREEVWLFANDGLDPQP